MTTKRKLTWLVIGLLLFSTITFVAMSNTSFAQPTKTLETGIEFTGQMNFNVEFLDNGFKPPFGGCPATAALIQVGRERYELRINEFGGCGGRMSI